MVSDSSETLAAALIPFQAAIAAGVKAIMSAHIVLSALDSEPATLIRRVLTGILRDELGVLSERWPPERTWSASAGGATRKPPSPDWPPRWRLPYATGG